MKKTTLTTSTLIAGIAAFALLLPGCKTYDPNSGTTGSLTGGGRTPKQQEPPPVDIKDEVKPAPVNDVNPLGGGDMTFNFGTSDANVETGTKTTGSGNAVVDVKPPTIDKKPITPPPSQPANYATTTYTVKSGDTVGAIANAHGLTKAQFIALNEIENPDKIKIGQKFKVPADGKPLPAGPRTAQPQAAPADGRTRHTVAKGEVLGGIAQTYGVKTAELVAWNELKNPDAIREGQILIVSNTKAQGATTTTNVAGGTRPQPTVTTTRPVRPSTTTTTKPPAPPAGPGDIVIKESPETPLDGIGDSTFNFDTADATVSAPGTYTVKNPGETLFSLITQNGWTVMEILELNPNIPKTDPIPVGTVIKLPK